MSDNTPSNKTTTKKLDFQEKSLVSIAEFQSITNLPAEIILALLKAETLPLVLEDSALMINVGAMDQDQFPNSIRDLLNQAQNEKKELFLEKISQVIQQELEPIIDEALAQYIEADRILKQTAT